MTKCAQLYVQGIKLHHRSNSADLTLVRRYIKTERIQQFTILLIIIFSPFAAKAEFIKPFASICTSWSTSQ